MDIKVLGKNFLLIGEVRIKISDVSSYFILLSEYKDAYNNKRHKLLLRMNISGKDHDFGKVLYKHEETKGREFIDEKRKILSELDAIFVKKEYKNADNNELLV